MGCDHSLRLACVCYDHWGFLMVTDVVYEFLYLHPDRAEVSAQAVLKLWNERDVCLTACFEPLMWQVHGYRLAHGQASNPFANPQWVALNACDIEAWLERTLGHPMAIEFKDD